MKTFDQALKIVLEKARPMPREYVALARAGRRILAVDIKSDINMPPWDVSAMDGFACRATDICEPLLVVETIPAGKMPGKKIGKGQCARIMTGAPVPDGADTVVMFEKATELENGLISACGAPSFANIRKRGENTHKGDIVLQQGTLISSAQIAVLASAGKERVAVYKSPTVGVLATGDELVEPGTVPRGAQIRNSNGPQLVSQVENCGCQALYYGIIKDKVHDLEKALSKAFQECDVILLSGGVSMGDFDYVPRILQNKKVTLHFEKIAVKPGKPTVFGTRGKTAFFGLPGNPVSTYVNFEVLVKPFLFSMMGHVYRPIKLPVKLATSIKRKKADRLEFRPVQINEKGLAELADYHGSAHMHAYSYADGIAAVPAGVLNLEAGSVIEVTFLNT